MQLTNDFYTNALAFAFNIIRRHDHVEHINKKDIVHDVICDCACNEDNWKSLIVSYVYKYKYSQFLYSLDGVPNAKPWIEHRYCKCCDEVMPEDYFISGWNAITREWQYRTICKFCYKQTDTYKQQAKVTSANYYERNKEIKKAKQKEYRKKNIDKTAKERYQRWKEKQKTLKLAS